MARNIVSWLLNRESAREAASGANGAASAETRPSPVIRRVAMSPTAAFVLPRPRDGSLAATLLRRVRTATTGSATAEAGDPASSSPSSSSPNGFGQSPMDALSDSELMAWRDALLAAATSRPQPASSAAVASLPDCTDELRGASDPDLLCSVCRDGLDDDETVRWVRLPCKHVFHRECVQPWLASHAHTCPNCRYPLERAADAGETTAGPAPDVVPPPQRTAGTVFSVLDHLLRHPAAATTTSASTASPAVSPAAPSPSPVSTPTTPATVPPRPHLATLLPIRRIFSLRFEVAGLPEGALELGHVRASQPMATAASAPSPVAPTTAGPGPVAAAAASAASAIVSPVVAPVAPLVPRSPPVAVDDGSPSGTVFGQRQEARRKRAREAGDGDDGATGTSHRLVRPRTRSSLLPPLSSSSTSLVSSTPARTLTASPACRTDEVGPSPSPGPRHELL